MGLMDSFISAMKISEGNEDEYMDDEYLDEEDVVEEKAPISLKAAEPAAEMKKATVSRISSVRQRKTGGGGMEVCVIKIGRAHV